MENSVVEGTVGNAMKELLLQPDFSIIITVASVYTDTRSEKNDT